MFSPFFNRLRSPSSYSHHSPWPRRINGITLALLFIVVWIVLYNENPRAIPTWPVLVADVLVVIIGVGSMVVERRLLRAIFARLGECEQEALYDGVFLGGFAIDRIYLRPKPGFFWLRTDDKSTAAIRPSHYYCISESGIIKSWVSSFDEAALTMNDWLPWPPEGVKPVSRVRLLVLVKIYRTLSGTDLNLA